MVTVGAVVVRPYFWLQALLRTWWMGYLMALVAVLVVNVIITFTEGYLPASDLSMLYLIAVLATAILFGRGPAILSSVGSFLAFDWFFVTPRYTFTVADPREWITLFLLLLTGIITSELAAGSSGEGRRRPSSASVRPRFSTTFYA